MGRSKTRCVLLFVGHAVFVALAASAGRGFLRYGFPPWSFIALAVLMGIGVAWPALYEVFVGANDAELRQATAFTRVWFIELRKTLGFVGSYIVLLVIIGILTFELLQQTQTPLPMFLLLPFLTLVGMLFAALGVSQGLREVFAVGTEAWYSNIVFIGEGVFPILFGLVYAVLEAGSVGGGPRQLWGRMLMVPAFWLLAYPIVAHKWVEASAERFAFNGTLTPLDMRTLLQDPRTVEVRSCQPEAGGKGALAFAAAGSIDRGRAVAGCSVTLAPAAMPAIGNSALDLQRQACFRDTATRLNRLYLWYAWQGAPLILLIGWLGQLDGVYVVTGLTSYLVFVVGFFAYPTLLQSATGFILAWVARVSSVMLLLVGVVLDTWGVRIPPLSPNELGFVIWLANGLIVGGAVMIAILVTVFLAAQTLYKLPWFYSKRLGYSSVAAGVFYVLATAWFWALQVVNQGVESGTFSQKYAVTSASVLRAAESVVASFAALLVALAVLGAALFWERGRSALNIEPLQLMEVRP